MRYALIVLLVALLGVSAAMAALSWQDGNRLTSLEGRLAEYLDAATQERRTSAQQQQTRLDSELGAMQRRLDAAEASAKQSEALHGQREESHRREVEQLRQKLAALEERADGLEAASEVLGRTRIGNLEQQRHRLLLLRLDTLVSLAFDLARSPSGVAAGRPLLLATADLAKTLPAADAARMDAALRRDLQAWTDYADRRDALAASLQGLQAQMLDALDISQEDGQAPQAAAEQMPQFLQDANPYLQDAYGVWVSVRDAALGLVSVRRLDENLGLRWSATERQLLHAVLGAQFSLARTALTMRDQALWEATRAELEATLQQLQPLPAGIGEALEQLRRQQLPPPPPPPANTETLLRSLLAAAGATGATGAS